MTPRNLVPSTPMRFNPTANSTSLNTGNRVIKGPAQSKDKSSVPLPPGYVDRAAQRRLGVPPKVDEPIEFSKVSIERPDEETEMMKDKLEFLEENCGIKEFPKCSNESIENLMKVLLGKCEKRLRISNEFRSDEAFLQFKSIEEGKTQPFDPFHRPKKVFRASSRKESFPNGFFDDSVVLERVKEALGRLKNVNERSQKYLEALAQQEDNGLQDDNIFPDVGVFDERAALETFINNSTKPSKVKTKDRLFKTAKKKEEVDIFELIAQKPLEEDEKATNSEESGGGLFGFSNILPKLNRLKDEANSGDNNNKLTGVYASILDDKPDEDSMVKLSNDYLEKDDLFDPNDSDEEGEEEDFGEDKKSNNKRKLSRKEDKEAAKVEKLVKTKFGVDLTK